MITFHCDICKTASRRTHIIKLPQDWSQRWRAEDGGEYEFLCPGCTSKSSDPPTLTQRIELCETRLKGLENK